MAKINLKKYLLAGVLVWLPIVASIWVIRFIITTSDSMFQLLPRQFQPEILLGYKIPGLGIVLAITLLLITGIFATNVLGRKIIQAWDSIFNHIPVIKSVYSSVKKVAESLLSDSKQSFKTPILIQFPHQNTWTIGFVSGEVPDNIPFDEQYISVYVPTTPNPTGGYLIMVKKTDTKEVNMSVDEALKYIISLGMVIPNKIDPYALESSSKKTIQTS